MQKIKFIFLALTITLSNCAKENIIQDNNKINNKDNKKDNKKDHKDLYKCCEERTTLDFKDLTKAQEAYAKEKVIEKCAITLALCTNEDIENMRKIDQVNDSSELENKITAACIQASQVWANNFINEVAAAKQEALKINAK
jgi:hypothetical protein